MAIFGEWRRCIQSSIFLASAETTITRTKPMMPHMSPVSLAAAAISAGRKVPKVSRPMTFLKTTVTRAPIGIMSIIFTRFWDTPILSKTE